jgi:hypothetical protein
VLILVGKESSILGQLHHHVYSVILDERVPKLNDMRMVDDCVQVDFSFKEKKFVLVGGVANVDLNSEGNTILTA